MATRILYLTYDGLADSLGQSQILPYLFGLSQKGFNITVISFEKNENLDRKKFIESEVIKNGIKWFPFSYTKRPPVISTVFDLIRMYIKVNSLYKKVGFDLIHCRSYLPGLVALKLKKERNIRWLFDIRGFWIEERIEGGLWDLNKPIYRVVTRFFKKKEKQFFAYADGIISLTHKAKDEIQKRFTVSSAITVIPCCVDSELFDPKTIDPVEREELLIRYQIGDTFNLIYLGSLGTWYDLDEMLRYFEQLKQTRNSKFLIVTKSEINKAIKNKYAELFEDVVIISAERTEVPKLLSLGHQGIFIYNEGYSRMACSPTKLGEMMSMGLPVLGNDIGDTRMILEKFRAGKILPKDSELKEVTHDSNQIRSGAIEYFSLSKGVDSYASVYERILRYR